jgi:hypothetical protein
MAKIPRSSSVRQLLPSCSVKKEVSMHKLTIAFSAVALGTLVGCGSRPVTPVVVTPPPTVVTTPAPAATPAPAPTVVVQSSSAARPGFGRIESLSAVPPSSAAAGGATMRRLGIKMEDGSMQYVDTAAGNIAIGERVELTSDGKIRH